MTVSPPPRRYLPAELEPSDWSTIEPLFDELEGRALPDADALERWLLDLDELAACLSEYEARCYIGMTCHTDDEEIERRYLHYVQEIDPKCEPRWFALKRRYLDAPGRTGLDSTRFEVYDRSVAAQVGIFRDANVPLQSELRTLDQQYDKICGAMTVEFDGEERTLPQMGRYLEVADRGVREDAWTRISQRRLRDREPIETLFESMLGLRQRIAGNAGYADYREYTWVSRERFDYTPEDCAHFHDAVERYVVPVRDRIDDERRQALGYSALRPWDLAVDPHNLPPLRPFENVDQLIGGVETILGRLSPDFARELANLRERGGLDLESRKGKAPGGYQYTLDESRQPFIFMNAAGLQRDVETLLHEGGHALHAMFAREHQLLAYRHAPMEFCEVASMAMEQLGRPHFDAFYPAEDAKRAARSHLEDVIALLPWVAIIDAFQHWLYTHPGHTREQRRDHWRALLERFHHRLDWSGHEEARDALWHRQGHLFGSPFYYIEYGIAQLGALQMWQRSTDDLPAALEAYRRALALGGSRPLPELFAAGGLNFDMGRETMGPLMAAVEAELARLA
jgi:oligoendopeptidase F